MESSVLIVAFRVNCLGGFDACDIRYPRGVSPTTLVINSFVTVASLYGVGGGFVLRKRSDAKSEREDKSADLWRGTSDDGKGGVGTVCGMGDGWARYC